MTQYVLHYFFLKYLYTVPIIDNNSGLYIILFDSIFKRRWISIILVEYVDENNQLHRSIPQRPETNVI